MMKHQSKKQSEKQNVNRKNQKAKASSSQVIQTPCVNDSNF